VTLELPPSSPLKRTLDTYLSFLYRPLRSAFHGIRALRFQRLYRRLVKRIVERRGLVVQSGPFQGMRYLDRACSSTLLPKLLGTYEDELHATLAKLKPESRRTIIDIGCAEGYYAVGLALRAPDAVVLAYDIDPIARAECAKLAALNGVAARVVVKERFEPTDMQAFGDSRPFVVCDVDGFEIELFAPRMSKYWINADLLVELHDYLGTPCRDTVERCLAPTHQIEIIESRLKNGDEYPDLADLTPEERELAVNEIRAPQCWLIAYGK